MTRNYGLWLLTITLLALALRLYNLTYHSLWFDEAISVHWARQSVPRILEVGFTLIEDRLPPLYYVLLKGWTSLAGFSETGVRSLSVLMGVLLVPILAQVASKLFNQRVALLTATLAGLNPFLIWYSQEARMYAQAVLFNVLTVWAFLRICESANLRRAKGGAQLADNRSPIRESNILHSTPYVLRFRHYLSSITPHLLFILFALAGLYSHLYAGFILPALGLWLVISYPRSGRLWLLFGLENVVIGLLFAPLAWAIWRFSGEATPGDPFSGLAQRAWWLLQAFTVWKAPLPAFWLIAIPTSYLFLGMAAYLTKPHQLGDSKPKSNLNHPLLLVTLLLLAPFVIANLLLWRNYLAFFGERYFIVLLPWLLLLVAVGLDRVSLWANERLRHNATVRAEATLGTMLLILTLLPLPGQWSVPAAKEAWRQSAAYLAQRAAPNHAILIHPDWVRYPFQFYFRGPGQTYAAFSTVTPTTDLDRPLQGVVKDHPVVWLIQSHLEGPDPNRLVEQWFAARYPLVTEAYPPGLSLKGYALGYQLDTLPPEAAPADIQFKNGLRLLGYQADRAVSASDELFHPPSGWAHVILYWTATQPLSEDAVPFVNLVGSAGIWGASLDRATDALKFYSTSRWPVSPAGSLPNFIIRHDVDVNLNPVTPPGVYQLVVGLHSNEAEQYLLTEIEVRP